MNDWRKVHSIFLEPGCSWKRLNRRWFQVNEMEMNLPRTSGWGEPDFAGTNSVGRGNLSAQVVHQTLM